MPAYVALLRGINVGGKHSLPMAKVRDVLAGAGASKVETYIQSGNVVFAHVQRSAAELTKLLATALSATAGFSVPVILRTKAAFGATIAANPFPTSDCVHCAFLPAAPTAEQTRKLAAIDGAKFLPSRFQIAGQAVYLDLPAGIGRDKLADSVLRALPDTTVRNWRTVTKLAEMLDSV